MRILMLAPLQKENFEKIEMSFWKMNLFMAMGIL